MASRTRRTARAASPAKKSTTKAKAKAKTNGQGDRSKGTIQLVWKELPEPNRGGGGGTATDWDPLIDELRKHPGETALLAVWAGEGTASTTATKLRKRYPDIVFQSHLNDERKSELYGYFPK